MQTGSLQNDLLVEDLADDAQQTSDGHQLPVDPRDEADSDQGDTSSCDLTSSTASLITSSRHVGARSPDPGAAEPARPPTRGALAPSLSAPSALATGRFSPGRPEGVLRGGSNTRGVWSTREELTQVGTLTAPHLAPTGGPVVLAGSLAAPHPGSLTGSPGHNAGLTAPAPRQAVSRTNSLVPDDSYCPPAWVSPSDVTNDCLWQPMKPGYAMRPEFGPGRDKAQGGEGAKTVVIRHLEVERVPSVTEGGFRQAIPVMHRSLAIACLVMNVISPGLGTFVSGASVMCGSRSRDVEADRLFLVWVNTWAALLQLATTPLFLLGWVWSIIWGYTFLKLSNEYNDGVRGSQRSLVSNSPSLVSVPPSHPTSLLPSTTRMTTTTTLSTQHLHYAPSMHTGSAPSMYNSSASQPLPAGHPSRVVLQDTGGQEGADPAAWGRRPAGGSASSTSQRARRHTRLQEAEARRRGVRLPPSTYPEILMAPGALESIVMNNGAFVSASNSGVAGGRAEQGGGAGDRGAGGARGQGSADGEASEYPGSKGDEPRLQTTGHR